MTPGVSRRSAGSGTGLQSTREDSIHGAACPDRGRGRRCVADVVVAVGRFHDSAECGRGNGAAALPRCRVPGRHDHPDIQYGSAPDLNTHQPVALNLDLYQPTGDTAAARPAVVYAHSGGFSGGDKAGEANLFVPLVERGFVVASINYRLLTTGCTGANLTPQCTVGAQAGINDGQAAVRWLRANAATEQGVGHVPPDVTVLTDQSARFYWLTMDLAHAQT